MSKAVLLMGNRATSFIRFINLRSCGEDKMSQLVQLTSFKKEDDPESRTLTHQKLREYCEELHKQIPLNNQVLFVKGPQLNLNAFEQEVARNRCYYAYPFTGAQYLKSALRGRGLEIDILDANFEFLKRAIEDDSFDPLHWTIILDEYFEQHNPSIVGISNLFDVDAPGFMQISEYLRTKRPGKQIILAGGQKATYSSIGLSKEDICHFALQREAENKIAYLFDLLYSSPNPRPPTPGILFKYQGEIFETKGPPDIVELKGSLVGEYDQIPIEEYCKVGTLSPYSRMAGKDKPFATVILNRGCHGGCTFCDVTDYSGRKVRSRVIDDLLDEMEYLYQERGVRHFEFLDDDFTVYKDRVLELLDGLKERGVTGMTWAESNGIIASCLNYELMKKFVETGCNGFSIGVESGNAEMLKRISKPGTIKKFREFSKLAQQFPELFIRDNYIIGFPAGKDPQGRMWPPENFQQMIDSFNFSIEMNLDWSAFSVYQPNSSYTEEKKEWADVYEDFIPTKDVFQGRLMTHETAKGMNVFTLPGALIPSREQLKEIWRAFNITRNYMLNKNLTYEGSPQKFIEWTRVIQERYPVNPEMSFFLALAYHLEGDHAEGDRQRQRTLENLKDPYWTERFQQYELLDLAHNIPRNSHEAEHMMQFMRDTFRTKYLFAR